MLHPDLEIVTNLRGTLLDSTRQRRYPIHQQTTPGSHYLLSWKKQYKLFVLPPLRKGIRLKWLHAIREGEHPLDDKLGLLDAWVLLLVSTRLDRQHRSPDPDPVELVVRPHAARALHITDGQFVRHGRKCNRWLLML